jgi:zinc protease
MPLFAVPRARSARPAPPPRVPLPALLAALIALAAAPAAADEAPPFRTETLDNGLLVLLAPTSANPVIALQAYVTTGGRTEDEYFQGSLHYIEHLVFKGGTPSLPPTEYRKKMALLGRESGGWTWHDEINFGFEVPKEAFDEALTTFKEALLDLQFEEEWFEAEKEVVIQELTRGMEEPGDLIFHNWHELAFQVHPYRRPVIGSEKAIRELDMSVTEAYYRERFTPNHMILSVAGDFEPDAMMAKIAEAWGALEPGPASFELGLEEPEQKGPRSRTDFLPQATDSRVLIGFVTPGGLHEDTAALEMLAELADDRSFGLPQFLEEQEKWVVSVDAEHYAMRDYGAFYVSARTDPMKARAVTDFITAFLMEFDVTQLPETVFEETRRAMLFDEANRRDSAAGRAGRLGFLTSRRGADAAAQLLDAYRTLTPQDVQAAKERWIGERRTVTATIHPDDHDPALASGVPVTPGAPFAPPPVDLNVAGALRPAEGDRLEYVRTDEGDGVHLYTFGNGMRLVVRPTDASDLLAVSGRVLGGQWVEPEGQAGINRAVAELGMRGTRRWNSEGFTRLRVARSIRAGAHAPSRSRANTSRNQDYRDAAGHHYLGLVGEWPTMLACLKETLFFPTFDPTEVAKLREDLLTEIRGLPEDNLEFIKQEFYVRAYPGHPYGRPTVGTEESVGNLETADLQEFHAAHWTPARTVVSVVGDVDPDQVAEWIASRWADLPDDAAEPWTVDVSAHPVAWDAPAETQVLALGKDYWTVNWGRPGAGAASDRLLTSIVLGRMAGNDHFYKYVYGEGVSYRSWINFWENLGAGTWILENDVKRDRFDEILAMFDEDLARYASQGFAPDEFDDAVQRLVNAHVLDQQDNRLTAWKLAVAVGDGLGFRSHTQRPEALGAVTFAQVQELAKDVFAPEEVLRLVQQ